MSLKIPSFLNEMGVTDVERVYFFEEGLDDLIVFLEYGLVEIFLILAYCARLVDAVLNAGEGCIEIAHGVEVIIIFEMAGRLIFWKNMEKRVPEKERIIEGQWQGHFASPLFFVFLFEVHNVMFHSRSVFYPIPSQFQDQQIFIKRDTLNKRLPKPISTHFSHPQEKAHTIPIHDNYGNLKKRLEEYIHKEKHKLELSFFGNAEPNFAKEKSKLIFRKNKGNKNSQHSIFAIPSQDFKLSFTEQVVRGRSRHEGQRVNASNSQASLVKESRKMKIKRVPHFNLRYESADQSTISYNEVMVDVKKKEEKKGNSTSLELPQERPFCIKRKKGRSKAKNDLTKNCQILGRQFKPQVVIFPSYSSLQVQELQRKKHELIKINKALKFRNTTKLCLKRVSEKSNDVGPWSKINHQEEENSLEHGESFCEQ